MSDVKQPADPITEPPSDDADDFKDIPTSVTGEGEGTDPVEALPAGVRAALQQVGGPEDGRRFELASARNTIGRLRENDVVLDGDAVSTLHAMVFFSTAGEWRIEDLNSTNGTRLNGSAVKEFGLKDGDEIRIGAHVLRFELPDAG